MLRRFFVSRYSFNRHSRRTTRRRRSATNRLRKYCRFTGSHWLTFRLPSYFLRHRLPRGGGYHPLTFSVWFKILFSVIKRLIQHCLLSKMVYLNITYVIATRNYEFFNTGLTG